MQILHLYIHPTTTETVVIKKMLNALDPEENKLFLKEVALLNSINHRNVKFMKVCHQPPAIMLEYVYFDFNIFGQDVRVNALSDFLLKINEHNCTGFQELVNHAATEIIDDLAYLSQDSPQDSPQGPENGEHFSK